MSDDGRLALEEAISHANAGLVKQRNESKQIPEEQMEYWPNAPDTAPSREKVNLPNSPPATVEKVILPESNPPPKGQAPPLNTSTSCSGSESEDIPEAPDSGTEKKNLSTPESVLEGAITHLSWGCYYAMLVLAWCNLTQGDLPKFLTALSSAISIALALIIGKRK